MDLDQHSDDTRLKLANNEELMEVEHRRESKQSKLLNYEELMTKQPNEIIHILTEKINSQQSEISGLWNRLRKFQKKH